MRIHCFPMQTPRAEPVALFVPDRGRGLDRLSGLSFWVMNRNEILAAIDTELSRLEQARKLLSADAPPAKRRGRPKGSTSKRKALPAPRAKSRSK